MAQDKVEIIYDVDSLYYETLLVLANLNLAVATELQSLQLNEEELFEHYATFSQTYLAASGKPASLSDAYALQEEGAQPITQNSLDFEAKKKQLTNCDRILKKVKADYEKFQKSPEETQIDMSRSLISKFSFLTNKITKENLRYSFDLDKIPPDLNTIPSQNLQ